MTGQVAWMAIRHPGCKAPPPYTPVVSTILPILDATDCRRKDLVENVAP